MTYSTHSKTLADGIHAVPAPEGYEGSVYYDDATRSWQPAVRRIGATYWKTTWLDAGSAHLPATEVLAWAEAAIRRQVELEATR